MKVLVRFLFVSAAMAVIAGCASDGVYVPKVPPQAQAKLLDYYKQPNNKVFVLAVDPGGSFAYGYDYGKKTLKEAAKVAAQKCAASCEANGVLAKPYIYALNDKVVYEEMIRKTSQAGAGASMQIQKQEVERVDAKKKDSK